MLRLSSFVPLAALLVSVTAQYHNDSRANMYFWDIHNKSEILTRETTLCTNTYYNWPKCDDTPKGYTCKCGPGFYWNTKICISDAVDSRLEFPAPVLPKNGSDQRSAFAYTLLLNKPFPLLDAFTMSMYMKPSVRHLRTRQCIFSYKYRSSLDDKDYTFSLFIGKKLVLTIRNQTRSVHIGKKLGADWSHLVVTWTASTGEANIYLNSKDGRLMQETMSEGMRVDSNGHMVLGQDSPTAGGDYDLDVAYKGNLAHVNIWKSLFSSRQLDTLFEDCSFTHCGDGVEWVDLREGTRGISRLRWPSGIYNDKACFSSSEARVSCDTYCSFIIGVQCKEEIRGSVTWVRTRAAAPNQSVEVVKQPCPGLQPSENGTYKAMANRSCTASPEKVGIWGEPQMENCLSPHFRTFARRVRYYMMGNSFDKAFVIELLSHLRNHTRRWLYNNPVDLTSTIRSLSSLIQSQRIEVEALMAKKIRIKNNMAAYTEMINKDELTYADTVKMSSLHLSILNELMDGRHDRAWNMTRPAGQEADRLLQLTADFTYLLSLSLKYHHLSQHSVEPVYRRSLTNIAIKVQMVTKTDLFVGSIFPDPSDVSNLEMSPSPATVVYRPHKLSSDNREFCLAILRLNTFSRLLYNPEKRQEDKINTPVVSVRLYEIADTALVFSNASAANSLFVLSNSSTSRMTLYFTNAKNVSNPECISIVHGNSTNNAVWSRDDRRCTLLANDSTTVSCECEGGQFFTGTTDMYNENWLIPEPPPELMTLPSYFGCILSLLFSICTLAMLVYVGTSSRTAIMHKHFAVSVIGSTATFMIGVTLTFNETVCKSVAILFHFFFLTMYAWLMNEAFNVYISITYTAHNQSTQENSGHWRYYIIGWGVPGILVSAIVGSSFDTYFSKDMCFASFDSIWLFIGPPIAMICVTILVMTFAAKENNEVSYTKNESANAMTEYHVNAVWTQLILVTCTWAIAFLSLKFKSLVFKWVFFIFNFAQGAFLFVFFFLLNEEVRSVFKTKEIKQSLGWEVSGRVATDQEPDEDRIPLNTLESTTHNDDSHEHSPDIPYCLGWTEGVPPQTPNGGAPLFKKTILVGDDVELDALTETSV